VTAAGLPELDEELLSAWLGGTASLADIAPRAHDDAQRRDLHADYAAIAAHRDAPTIIAILRQYVRSTLPLTRALERMGWTVTGPSAHRSAADAYRRIAAVTVGPEETLVLSESRLGTGLPEPGGFLLVDQFALEDRVGPVSDMQRDFGGTFARTWLPGAQDRGIVSLGFYDWGTFRTLMAAPQVVAAARHLNVRLLEESPSRQPERHVFDLADHLVAIMPGDRPLSGRPAVAAATGSRSGRRRP
jgi:hypothetical protein